MQKAGTKLSSGEKEELLLLYKNFCTEAEKFMEKPKKKKSAKTENSKTKKMPKLLFPKPKSKKETDEMFEKRILENLLINFRIFAKKENALKWNFPRKFAEFLGGKICTQDIFNYFKNAFVFLSVSPKEREIASLLVNSSYSSFLSGANEFNGIKWFNKEMMETSLKTGEYIYSLKSSKKQKEKIKAVFENLQDSAENSEFKCENFIKPFCPKKNKKVPGIGGAAKAVGKRKFSNEVEDGTPESPTKKHAYRE